MQISVLVVMSLRTRWKASTRSFSLRRAAYFYLKVKHPIALRLGGYLCKATTAVDVTRDMPKASKPLICSQPVEPFSNQTLVPETIFPR